MSQWGKNKIIGSISESCVEQHFEHLGYKVEKTGIEHIAPFYTHLESETADENWGHYSEIIREKYRGLPDFLISRIHPDEDCIPEKGIRNKKLCGKAEAQFIEAKFRSNANLETLEKKFMDQYGKEAMIYLVANGYQKDTSCELVQETAVFVNYLKYPQWWQAGHEDADFDKHVFYMGNELGTTFNTLYQDTIKPALFKIFGNCV